MVPFIEDVLSGFTFCMRIVTVYCTARIYVSYLWHCNSACAVDVRSRLRLRPDIITVGAMNSVGKCRELEDYCGTGFTSDILQEGSDSCPHPREIRVQIFIKDCELLLSKHEGRADMSLVVEVHGECNWMATTTYGTSRLTMEPEGYRG